MKTKTIAIVVALGACLGLGGLIGQAIADQPHMQAALDHLRAARAELATAETDKGGHRAMALRLTDQAIAETEAGIKYDRSHR